MHFWLGLLAKAGLTHWSYWSILLISALESTVALGLVIPGTTILIFSGFLAEHGILNFWVLIWFVAAGGVIGDGLSFYLGRQGTRFFKTEGKILKQAHLKKGEDFFKNHGEKSVIIARFVGPLRPIVPFVAGLFKMKPAKFFLFNIAGGILGAAFYLSLGYYFGGVLRSSRHLWRFGEVLIVILFLALAAGYFWKKELFNK